MQMEESARSAGSDRTDHQAHVAMTFHVCFYNMFHVRLDIFLKKMYIGHVGKVGTYTKFHVCINISCYAINVGINR